jgi:hypothetical protein
LWKIIFHRQEWRWKGSWELFSVNNFSNVINL